MSAWQTFGVTLDAPGFPHYTRRRFTGYAALITWLGPQAASSQQPCLQALPAGVRPLAWTGLDPERAQVLWNDGVLEEGVPVPAGLRRVDRGWLSVLMDLQAQRGGGRAAQQLREHWLTELLRLGLEDAPPRWQLSALVPGGVVLHAEQYPLVKLSSDHHSLVYPGAQPPYGPPTWASLHQVTFGLRLKLGGPVEVGLQLPRAALGTRRTRHDVGALLRGHLAALLKGQATKRPEQVAAQLAQALGGEVLPAGGSWDEVIALEECTGFGPEGGPVRPRLHRWPQPHPGPAMAPERSVI